MTAPLRTPRPCYVPAHLKHLFFTRGIYWSETTGSTITCPVQAGEGATQCALRTAIKVGRRKDLEVLRWVERQ